MITADAKELAANYLKAAEQVGGCMDGGCVILQPTGQHTNGGCRCVYKMDPLKERAVRQLLMRAQHLAREVLK